MRSIQRSRVLVPLLASALLTTVAACGASSAMDHPAMSGHSSPPSEPPSMSGMDMNAIPSGAGLSDKQQGFTLSPSSNTLTGDGFRFRVLGPDGGAVTSFEAEQTRLMHFYLVRSDLSGYQHVHPTMAADGTWTAPLARAAPGSYRIYASFTTRASNAKPVALVLSSPVTVPGAATTEKLPAAAPSTTVDGYTVTLDAGHLMAGATVPVRVTITRGGKAVTDVEPYLGTSAHLSAFHDGDMAFAHLHPRGTGLTFEATLPEAGDWRLFLQFQTGGVLHTAAITVSVM